MESTLTRHLPISRRDFCIEIFHLLQAFWRSRTKKKSNRKSIVKPWSKLALLMCNIVRRTWEMMLNKLPNRFFKRIRWFVGNHRVVCVISCLYWWEVGVYVRTGVQVCNLIYIKVRIIALRKRVWGCVVKQRGRQYSRRLCIMSCIYLDIEGACKER